MWIWVIDSVYIKTNLIQYQVVIISISSCAAAVDVASREHCNVTVTQTVKTIVMKRLNVVRNLSDKRMHVPHINVLAMLLQNMHFTYHYWMNAKYHIGTRVTLIALLPYNCIYNSHRNLLFICPHFAQSYLCQLGQYIGLFSHDINKICTVWRMGFWSHISYTVDLLSCMAGSRNVGPCQFEDRFICGYNSTGVITDAALWVRMDDKAFFNAPIGFSSGRPYLFLKTGYLKTTFLLLATILGHM